jgi:hypothetical protein
LLNFFELKRGYKNASKEKSYKEKSYKEKSYKEKEEIILLYPIF